MKEFILLMLAFFAGFLFRSFFSSLFIAGTYLKYMRDLEIKFLLMGVNFMQWKHHALQILELTYEKVSEEDPEQKENFKVFKNKVEEKYQQTEQGYIMYMSNILPYSPKYKTWDQAMKYLEDLRKEGKL